MIFTGSLKQKLCENKNDFYIQKLKRLLPKRGKDLIILHTWLIILHTWLSNLFGFISLYHNTEITQPSHAIHDYNYSLINYIGVSVTFYAM